MHHLLSTLQEQCPQHVHSMGHSPHALPFCGVRGAPGDSVPKPKGVQLQQWVLTQTLQETEEEGIPPTHLMRLA